MKKEYISPEQTVVDLLATDTLLTGSTELPITDDPVEPRVAKERNAWEEL